MMDDESKQMHVNSLNVQVSNHQSRKDSLPVIKHAGSSGKGFPYAPEDFPSSGDVWTWHVGRRHTHKGFWQDRLVLPPDRLQNSTGNKISFRSRTSLEQYIRKTFPEADVNAFFASFVWKIPCANVAKDASLKAIKSKRCSNSAAIVHSGDCKAGNEMCLIKSKTGFALTPATCNICCSEPSFCRNCCCILCSKTIDWIYDGYSFVKCEALVDKKFICGHVAHIECALRAYLAGKVGGSIDLDAQYYCRCCDNKTKLLSHVQKIIKVSESIVNRDDMVKVLNLGYCMLRGSKRKRATKLRNHILTSIEMLKHGVLGGDIWEKKSGMSEFEPGATVGTSSSKRAIWTAPPVEHELKDYDPSIYSALESDDFLEDIYASVGIGKRAADPTSRIPLSSKRLKFSEPGPSTQCLDDSDFVREHESTLQISSPDPLDDVNQGCEELGHLISPADPIPSKSPEPTSAKTFRDIAGLVLQSPCFSIPAPTRSHPATSHPATSDKRFAVLKHLLVATKYLFESGGATSELTAENIELKNRIAALNAQLVDLTIAKTDVEKERDAEKAEKERALEAVGSLEVLLKLERNAKRASEDQVELLSGKLSNSNSAVAKLTHDNDTMKQKLKSAKGLVSKSISIINDAKKKVSDFLEVPLNVIIRRSFEKALFTAYRDNVEKFPDMDFPSYRHNDLLKSKFKAMLAGVPDPGKDVNAAELLIIEDPPVGEVSELDDEGGDIF